jgi:hypothetical protein
VNVRTPFALFTVIIDLAMVAGVIHCCANGERISHSSSNFLFFMRFAVMLSGSVLEN